MIKFYYIGGITRFDTPYFLSIELQKQFFSSKLIGIMEDSYYPPHYRNQITVSSDELDFNTQIDYLSLEYNNKEYYYFIDDIEYGRNPNLIILHITMDTIQTYMFNIKFLSSEVSRKLINRWNGNEINRDYLRENLSSASKQVKDYVDYDDDNIPFLVIRTLEKLYDTSNTPITKLMYNGKILSDGSIIYLLPFPFIKDINYIKIYYQEDEDERYNRIDSIGTIYNQLYEMSKNPKIVEIYLLNNLPLKYNKRYETTSVNNDTLVLDFSMYDFSPSGEIFWGDGMETNLGDSGIILSFPNLPINIELNKNIYNFNFIKNINVANSFNYLYVPQLLDENYYEYVFGERLGYTGYPLHLLTKPELINHSVIDILTDNRIYFILSQEQEQDKYLTSITNQTKESYMLINDAWLQYQALNHGTLTTGKNLAHQKLAYQEINKSISSVSNIVGKIVQGDVAGSISSGVSYGASVAMMPWEHSMIDQQFDVTQENMEFTPDTEKQGNNMSSDLLNRSLHRIVKVSEVLDIEDVARKLEGYGYKVHEQYSTENLFNVLNTRTIFNIIQCNTLSITLDVICDNTTLELIKERFTNGIRMWNNIDSQDLFIPFKYDNVEKNP